MIEADQIVTVNGLETPSSSLEGAVRYYKGGLYSCNGRAWTRHGSTTSQSASIVGPLEQAIYVQSVDKIFGVCGPWIYSFDPITGIREASYRWNPDLVTRTSLCHLDGVLYAVGLLDSRSDRYWALNGPPHEDSQPVNLDVFAIDLGLNSSEGLGIAEGHLFNNNSSQKFTGFTNLVAGAEGQLYGLVREYGYRFRVDPADSGTYAETNTGDTADSTWTDALWDSSRNAFTWSNGVGSYPGEVNSTSDWAYWDFSNTDSKPLGITLVVVNGDTGDNYYAVTHNGHLYKLVIDGGTLSSVLTGLKAVKLKWHQTSNRIYIPDVSNDRIVIFNPVNDSVDTIKMGFSNPIDVVFTSTKKWAIQQSIEGLKEIV